MVRVRVTEVRKWTTPHYIQVWALSKVFESVLLEMFEGVLSSDNLQFGLKKKTGCSDALFAFNETVRYFTCHGCKVYSAFLLHCCTIHCCWSSDVEHAPGFLR